MNPGLRMNPEFNVKLAQRFVRFLSRLRERIEERETGKVSFIIRVALLPCPLE